MYSPVGIARDPSMEAYRIYWLYSCLYFFFITRVICSERNDLLANIQVVLTDTQLQRLLL